MHTNAFKFNGLTEVKRAFQTFPASIRDMLRNHSSLTNTVSVSVIIFVGAGGRDLAGRS